MNFDNYHIEKIGWNSNIMLHYLFDVCYKPRVITQNQLKNIAHPEH